MTTQATAPATIEHLDWVPNCQAPGCEMGWPPAKWISHQVCGCISYSCDDCKEAHYSNVANFTGSEMKLQCRQCGEVFVGDVADAQWFEPL